MNWYMICNFMQKTMGYRSSHQKCSIKTLFLKISQNSLENTCARVCFWINLHLQGEGAGGRAVTLLKKWLWHRCCPVNFVEFSRISQWVFLGLLNFCNNFCWRWHRCKDGEIFFLLICKTHFTRSFFLVHC